PAPEMVAVRDEPSTRKRLEAVGSWISLPLATTSVTDDCMSKAPLTARSLPPVNVIVAPASITRMVIPHVTSRTGKKLLAPLTSEIITVSPPPGTPDTLQFSGSPQELGLPE